MTFRNGLADFPLLCCIFALVLAPAAHAQETRVVLRGHRPAGLATLTPKARLPANSQISLAIGLPVRDQAGLSASLAELYDPRSTNFHKFITPQEFAARFGPREEDYQAVIDFARANGLTVSATHPN